MCVWKFENKHPFKSNLKLFPDTGKELDIAKVKHFPIVKNGEISKFGLQCKIYTVFCSIPKQDQYVPKSSAFNILWIRSDSIWYSIVFVFQGTQKDRN